MSAKKIEDLERLVAPFLPKTHTFASATLENLTSSGDNYGSLLLSVDIIAKNEHNQEEHTYAVAKKLPSNELVQEMFNSQYSFPNEVGFYQTIVPCLKQFQREKRVTKVISSFPDFYSARVNRDPIGKIDQDSVLLIKNIKNDGFEILDRTVGFDLSQTRLILDKMAELHATIIALKTQRPDIFKQKVVPFLQEYETFVMDEEIRNEMVKWALDVVKDDEVCRKYLPQLEELMKQSCVESQKKNAKYHFENEFFSLVHSDMWTNNIMVKMVNGEITDVKFVDFQLYEHASLTIDVVFFIYSSTRLDILKENCDDLLLHYYHSFIKNLQMLDCDSSVYSYDKFLEDMKVMVKKFEFFHILTMLPPIHATSKDTKDVELLEMDNFIFSGTEVTEAHREKACFVVRDFLKRGWVP